MYTGLLILLKVLFMIIVMKSNLVKYNEVYI